MKQIILKMLLELLVRGGIVLLAIMLIITQAHSNIWLVSFGLFCYTITTMKFAYDWGYDRKHLL